MPPSKFEADPMLRLGITYVSLVLLFFTTVIHVQLPHMCNN